MPSYAETFNSLYYIVLYFILSIVTDWEVNVKWGPVLFIKGNISCSLSLMLAHSAANRMSQTHKIQRNGSRAWPFLSEPTLTSETAAQRLQLKGLSWAWRVHMLHLSAMNLSKNSLYWWDSMLITLTYLVGVRGGRDLSIFNVQNMFFKFLESSDFFIL